MTDELHQKREKARRYATEPERFKITQLQLTMNSEHDERHIHFQDNQWMCTCDFFKKQGTCSHIMAAMILFQNFTPP